MLACLLPAAAGHAAEPVTLNLWHIPPAWCPDPERKSQYILFQTFLKQHPGLEVEQGQPLTILGPAGDSSFLLAMAGGIAPDLFPVSLGRLSSLVDQRLLLPLDGLFAAWPERGRIARKFVAAATVDGSLYGIVTSTYAPGLIYRKDLFREAGLDPDRAPQTWAELAEVARRLTLPERGQFGLGMRPEELFLSFLWQAGGELVRARPDGTLECAIASDSGVRALEFVRDLHAGGAMRRPTSEAALPTHDLANGVFAMAVVMQPEAEYQYVLPKVPAYNVGVAALPAGPAGKVTTVGCTVWCINGTLDPEDPRDRRRIEAAWSYITWLAGDEAAQLRTEVYVERGAPHFLPPDHLERYGYAWALEQVDPSLRGLHEEIYRHGRVEPTFRGAQSVYLLLRTPIDAVMANPAADCRALLEATAARIDREVFDRQYDRLPARAQWLARGVTLLLAAVFLVFFVRAMQQVAEKARAETYVHAAGSRRRARMHLAAWGLMLPALASILLWAYIPLLRGSLMAFQDYFLRGESRFVGLANFVDVFTTPMFYRMMLQTLYYVFLSLALGFAAPIVLALLLSEVPRGKVFFRVVFFLPAVTSGLVIMFLWRRFYDPTEAGLFNYLLLEAGLVDRPLGWLQDKLMAMLCIVLPGVWAGAGPGSIIYIAALVSVPSDLYEAADVDGAGTLRKIWHIALPHLRALIIINFVGAFIGAFHAMQNILVMTGGGPEDATYTIGLDIFYSAFVYLRFGYATALAWVLGALLIGFTMYQLRLLKHVSFQAAESKE